MPDPDPDGSLGRPLQILVQGGSSRMVCSVRGPVELGSLNHLADALRVAFVLSPHGPVLLDLVQATGLTSSVKRAIDQTVRAARAGGRRVVVSGLNQRVAPALAAASHP